MAYFLEADLRALPQMDDTTRYTTARVTEAREYVEALIEREVGTSFEARSWTETHDGGDYSVVLRRPYVLSITSVTEDGDAVTGYDYTYDAGLLERRPTGSTDSPTAWASGRRNITVTYTAGYSSTPPADVKRAALAAAREWLLKTYGSRASSSRTSKVTTEHGTVDMFIAGKDMPTGIPDVDAVIIGYRDKLDVHGFA